MRRGFLPDWRTRVIFFSALLVLCACVVAIARADSDWIELDYAGIKTTIGWRRMEVNQGNAVDVKCTDPDDASKCETAGFIAVSLVSAAVALSLIVMVTVARGKAPALTATAAFLALVAVLISWSLYYGMTLWYRLNIGETEIEGTDYFPGWVTFMLIGALVPATLMTFASCGCPLPCRSGGRPWLGVPDNEPEQ